MNEFIYTTALDRLRNLTARIKIAQGGTSAGKTYGILPIEIDYAARNAGTVTSVVSESIPHLRRGALKDFESIMRSTNRWIEDSYNKSLLTYTFANGSYIEFFSADQPDRLRGARRNRLYINEANNITWDAYVQLAIRTSDSIFLDYNPTGSFWVQDELLDDEDAEIIILTYKDNEALQPSIVREIEKAKEKAKHSSYWANWWRVYGLGLVGALEGVVLSNWEPVPALPGQARLLGCGLDFGYSNDPTAIVGIYYMDGVRIAHEMLYKKGMVNEELAAYLPRNVPVWADSAEPKSIEEIRRMGFDIRPVTKGRDSIMYGLQIMQGLNYKVTESSTNLIRELRNYCFETDKTGKTLNKPIDSYNHGIDAWRYHEMMAVGQVTENFFF